MLLSKLYARLYVDTGVDNEDVKLLYLSIKVKSYPIVVLSKVFVVFASLISYVYVVHQPSGLMRIPYGDVHIVTIKIHIIVFVWSFKYNVCTDGASEKCRFCTNKLDVPVPYVVFADGYGFPEPSNIE